MPRVLAPEKASIPDDESAIHNELFAALSYFTSRSSWYPTLRNLHWILSLLHDFVDVSRYVNESHQMPDVSHLPLQPAIFEDMAGEAISTCRQSLVSASQRMAAHSSEL